VTQLLLSGAASNAAWEVKPRITSDAVASVVGHQASGVLNIAVSDPTQPSRLRGATT